MPDRTDRQGRPQARKRFGQHFLEPVWAEKVVKAIAPAAYETFLEIGPGPGAITRLLVARTGRVAAFEIDRDMVRHLQADAPPSLAVVEGDFLEITAAEVREALRGLGAHDDDPIRVAGNLPYNVASPILFKIGELRAAGLPIVDASVMLQREVADRLLAAVGTRDYSALTVLIRHTSHVTRLLNLPPGAFRPPPKVQSTVVRLAFHDATPPVHSASQFAAVVRAVFTRRRKMLSNALLAHHQAAAIGPAVVLARAGIDGSRRPETLSLEEFGRLADVVSPSQPPLAP